MNRSVFLGFFCLVTVDLRGGEQKKLKGNSSQIINYSQCTTDPLRTAVERIPLPSNFIVPQFLLKFVPIFTIIPVENVLLVFVAKREKKNCTVIAGKEKLPLEGKPLCKSL